MSDGSISTMRWCCPSPTNPLRACSAAVLASGLYFSHAPTVWSHGDVDEHIEELAAQLATGPKDEILVRRARLYLEAGRPTAARRDLLLALKLAPARYENWYYLADANRLLGRIEAALKAVNMFIARASTDAARERGQRLRGDILMGAGESAQSAKAYLAALALASEPDPGHYLRAAEALHLASDARAIAVLDQGITRLGPLSTLDDRALDFEEVAGQPAAALVRVERMLWQGQRTAPLAYRKGLILKAMRRADEAQAAFLVAIQELDRLPEGRRQTRANLELRAAINQQLGR